MRSDGARRYRFAAWTVASDVALPELPPSDAEPDWRVVRGAVSLRQRHTAWYQRTAATDGLPWVWLGRRGGVDVIRFPGLAWCEISAGQKTIACTWRRHLGHEEPEHLLTNHILPMALSAEGFLVLHASVAARPGGGAVAFVGHVGAGKSTLATFLGTRGWTILSDDRLILDPHGLAYAAAPYVRISPQAAAHLSLPAALPEGHHKVRIPLATGWDPTPRALERIVFLQRDPHGTRLEAVPGREASIEMLSAILQLGLDRPEVRRRIFERVAGVLTSVPCSRLRMTARWESLADAERVVLDACQAAEKRSLRQPVRGTSAS